MIIIYTDGGARGNPGPAALGVVIEDSMKKKTSFGKFLNLSTNNFAEYSAVLAALVFLLENYEMGGREEVQFYLDSQLVERQLNGIYKIKEPTLQQLALQIKQKIGEWGSKVFFTHIPREQNREADKIVNQVLDQAAHVG